VNTEKIKKFHLFFTRIKNYHLLHMRIASVSLFVLLVCSFAACEIFSYYPFTECSDDAPKDPMTGVFINRIRYQRLFRGKCNTRWELPRRQQVLCSGECCKYAPDVITCIKVGGNTPSTLEWTCEHSGMRISGLVLVDETVSCEMLPNNEHLLEGSCVVSFAIMRTDDAGGLRRCTQNYIDHFRKPQLTEEGLRNGNEN
jgi:hypothetical protein